MGIGIKYTIKKWISSWNPAIHKGLEYDRLTHKIIKKVVRPDSNCIDVGAHKGEILSMLIKQAPYGQHFAFEPIPHLYDKLGRSFGQFAKVYPYALSNEGGQSNFYYVENAPAYSGLKKRDYQVRKPNFKELIVQVSTLDDILPDGIVIDFIKIDVEGGEFNVLKGGKKTILASRPVIIFECGLGASNYYHTDPSKLYDYISDVLNLKLHTLKSYLAETAALSKQKFIEIYDSNEEYYFIAHP